MEGVLILGALAAILVFFILPRRGVLGPSQNFAHITDPNTYNTYAADRAAQGGTGTIANSSYSSLISLGQGNAAYSIEPAEEYITIQNQSESPINITGWKLTNNKGNRTYYSGNQAVHYASDEMIIPQATGYISPTGGFNLAQNVVLAPNDMAIITTGSVGVQSPYKITSFKENECSGYIEALPQYDFTPTLNYACVSPSLEPGLSNLDTACKNFVSGISGCQTPVFGQINRGSTDNCDNCVNGRPAPSTACLNFIKDHFNYPGCINYHKDDPKFYSNTWRIFLAKQWEVWDKQDEVISLFDQFGKLAAYKSY
ncbi:MAG: seg [Parcubacteria group bacterium]|nr:seg [Parcubacteria group bacterium]